VSFRRSDYHYELPPERIASRPASERTASRLMVIRRDAPDPAAPEHATFAELPRYLAAGDLLVLNDTRVIPARLLGVRRQTGGKMEILLVRRSAGGPQEGTASGGQECWEVLCRPGKKLGPGSRFVLAGGALRGEVLHHTGSGRRQVSLSSTEPGRTVSELVAEHGHVPLPPYIRRPDDQRDRDDYQTVYARAPGAVAAPTAGLHFTHELLAELGERGVGVARLTLHVGPGTFTPVAVDDVREHVLDPERFELPAETAARIDATRRSGGRVVAVGTTVVRTLESRVEEGATGKRVSPGSGEADLFIHPPFRFRAVDAMITNFHLPESTLLMLVAAFAGRERILAAYREAVERGYRFYSYGDATLIL
jgi:S-adenosylmethionine:tRNA ribosyltransferase-isomerase